MIRAVVFAAGPWITARDLRLPVAGPSDRAFSARQQRIVLLVRHHGPVSCRDVAARVGISDETARVELSALVGFGIVRRHGRRRGCRYAPVDVPLTEQENQS